MSTIGPIWSWLKPVEQDDLVEPVEEFGPEMGAHHLHHLRLDLLDVLAVGEVREELAAEVRRSG